MAVTEASTWTVFWGKLSEFRKGGIPVLLLSAIPAFRFLVVEWLQCPLEHFAGMYFVGMCPIVEIVDDGFAEKERDLNLAAFGSRFFLTAFRASTFGEATVVVGFYLRG